jgi:hypothetical protein
MRRNKEERYEEQLLAKSNSYVCLLNGKIRWGNEWTPIKLWHVDKNLDDKF